VLGVLDSGVGGLTVLQRIREKMPGESLVYFADQANSPLGVRPAAELSLFFRSYVARLQDMDVDGIAMGSNTLCAIARDHGWPASSVPIIDMIEPTARAVAATGKKKVGVLATSATVRSGVYGAAIRTALAGADVQEVAASELVEYVEQGLKEGEGVTESLRAAFSRFSDPIDLLVLGCTHFPWIQDAIRAVFGREVELLDPAHAVAREVALHRGEPICSERSAPGLIRFMTTGDVRKFEQNIKMLIGPLRKGDVVVQAEAVCIG
jgi:glutamate racemase